MATHSSILAWRIAWTEEPGGLQSTGSQRVRHDLMTKQLRKNFRVSSPDFHGTNGLMCCEALELRHALFFNQLINF